MTVPQMTVWLSFSVAWGDGPPVATEVTALRVVREAPDHLSLEVDCAYDGSHGPVVSLGGLMTLEGRSTGYFAYTPAQVVPGTTTARLELGLNAQAPRQHRSDGLLVQLYGPQGAVFHQREFPYDKVWTNPDPAAPEVDPRVAAGQPPRPSAGSGPAEPAPRWMNTAPTCVTLAQAAAANPRAVGDEDLQRLIACLASERFYRDDGAALQAFVRVGEPAVAPLAAALAHPDDATAEGAARALGAIGRAAEPAVPALQATVRRATSPGQASAFAAEALGRIGEVGWLTEVARGADPGAPAWLGARGLGAAGPAAEDAVPTLIGMLDSANPMEAMSAAEALGRVGPSAAAAVPRLGELVRGGSLPVSHAATDALVAIGTAEARAEAAPALAAREAGQGFFRALGIFVWQPGRAVAVAALLAAPALIGAVARPQRAQAAAWLLVPALSWAAYAAWEWGARAQGANLRVDLLLIYPLLALTTLAGCAGWLFGTFRATYTASRRRK